MLILAVSAYIFAGIGIYSIVEGSVFEDETQPWITLLTCMIFGVPILVLEGARFAIISISNGRH